MLLESTEVAMKNMLLCFLRPSHLGHFGFAFQPVARLREKERKKAVSRVWNYSAGPKALHFPQLQKDKALSDCSQSVARSLRTTDWKIKNFEDICDVAA